MLLQSHGAVCAVCFMLKAQACNQLDQSTITISVFVSCETHDAARLVQGLSGS